MKILGEEGRYVVVELDGVERYIPTGMFLVYTESELEKFVSGFKKVSRREFRHYLDLANINLDHDVVMK